jgi:hypothetical protein
MTTDTLDAAPARLARITGALLLVMAAASLFAELGVRQALVVPGDALATVERIQASPQLFRLGLLGYLTAFLLDVPTAVLFYRLLRHVNRTMAMLAAAFRLVYAAVVGAALIPYLGAMLLLDKADYLSAVETDELRAYAMFHLDLFGWGFTTSLVFFGVYLVLLGILLARSRQLPAVLGVLLSIGGVAYVIDGVLRFLAPAVRENLMVMTAILALTELVLAVWLVVKGLRPATQAR